MKIVPFFLSLVFLASCQSEPSLAEDITAIKAILRAQEKAWSDYDIEGFMEGYWQSDSLKFYGKGGLTRGWQQTLENYKKRYPTRAETGQLRFVIDDISPIGKDAYWVMGQYHLSRPVGDARGTFLIVLKRIDGVLKIVADSSC